MNNNGKINVNIYKLIYKRIYKDIKKYYKSQDFIIWENSNNTYILVGVQAFQEEEGITIIFNPHHYPKMNLIKDIYVASVVKSYI